MKSSKNKKSFKPIVYWDEKHTIQYILVSELPEEERKPFCKWMIGQTCPLIEGREMTDTVYPWDYDRWQRYCDGHFVVWD